MNRWPSCMRTGWWLVRVQLQRRVCASVSVVAMRRRDVRNCVSYHTILLVKRERFTGWSMPWPMWCRASNSVCPGR